jgi:hypothetical protein
MKKISAKCPALASKPPHIFRWFRCYGAVIHIYAAARAIASRLHHRILLPMMSTLNHCNNPRIGWVVLIFCIVDISDSLILYREIA